MQHSDRERPAGERGSGASSDHVLATIVVTRPELERIAARVSLCHDDVEDAVSCALEIYLRRAGDLDPGADRLWLKEVVKNEALRIRRSRARVLPIDNALVEKLEDIEVPDEDAAIAAYDRVGRSAEALKGLTPEQVAALLEVAVGYSYEEIARRHEWSSRKTCRSVTEGRRRFHDRYGEIARGRECRRWARVLRAIGEGRGGRRIEARMRPHLAHCPGCRRAVADVIGRRSRRGCGV